jgi:hypothetical protein
MTAICHPERSEGSVARIRPADLTHLAFGTYGESPGRLVVVNITILARSRLHRFSPLPAIELYNLRQSIGFERGSQDAMALLSFFWRNAVEWLAHPAGMSKFVTECRPHL